MTATQQRGEQLFSSMKQISSLEARKADGHDSARQNGLVASKFFIKKDGPQNLMRSNIWTECLIGHIQGLLDRKQENWGRSSQAMEVH